MQRILAIVAALCLFAALSVHAGQRYEVKFASSIPDTMKPDENPELMFIDRFAKAVEKKSNGAIKVTHYGSHQLGNATEAMQGVRSGYIEAAVLDNTIFNSVLPRSQLLNSPGVFASVEECDAILSGDWGKKYQAEIEAQTGIHMLGIISKGFRNFTTSNKELRVPADAKGVTFRVMQSPVSIKMVEALGGKAVPMPGSEMYMAMRNGVVDGQENPVISIVADRTYEVQKYLVLDGHIAGVVAFVMSGKLYESLPPDLKKAVDEAAVEAGQEAQKSVAALTREGIEILKKQGMTVYQPSEAELKEWRDAIFKPTQDFLRQSLGSEMVDDLAKAVEAQRKSGK